MANFYAQYPASAAGGSNASVGTNGLPAPTSSTEVGFIDGSGNLQGVSSAEPLPVTIISGPNPTNVNVADIAGTPTAVGAGASSAGTQRVILSSDSPLAPGAATAANQTSQITQETAIATSVASIDTKTPTVGQKTMTASSPVVIASDQSAVPISASSLPLPAGAATSANQSTEITSLSAINTAQTSGSQKSQVVDGANATVGPLTTISGVNYLPVIQSSSGTPGSAVPARSTVVGGSDGVNVRTLSTDTSGNVNVNVKSMVPAADSAPATQNITVVDSGSTTTAQANGQNAITGSPTAGSVATFAVSSENSVDVQVTGTWTGTLSNEVSIDNGVTWFARGIKQTGTSYISTSYTQNFEASGNVTGVTNIRVRATAAMTGTATVKVVLSANSYVAIVTNPLTLRDSVTQSISNTIKAASTAAIATDTALVVAVSPNNNVTVTQSTAANLLMTDAADGSVAPGTVAGKSQLGGGQYVAAGVSLTDQQQAAMQMDTHGNMQVVQPDIYFTGAAAQTATVNNILPSASGSAATDTDNYRSFSVQVISTGTGGTFIFEGSNDNVNFVSVPVFNVALTTGAIIAAAITASASNIVYSGSCQYRYLRLRIATTITGGSIQAFTKLSQMPHSATSQIVAQSTSANLLVSATISSGTVSTVLNSNTGIPNSVTDIASAAITTTTTTAAITPSNGSSYNVEIAVTVVSGTNPTMSTSIQESQDAGVNWYTVYTFPLITATGFYVSPILAFQGNRLRYVQTIGGTTPSFTRAVTRLQQSNSMPGFYRNLIDTSINPTSTNSATAVLNVENLNSYTAIINQGSGGSAVTFAMDGSDDQVNWVNSISSVAGVVGGSSPVIMNYSSGNFRFIRVRVVTGVAATTISYVSLIGAVGSVGGSETGILTNRSGTTSGTPSTSTQVVGPNCCRKYFIIQNLDATNTIYINFTAAADTSNSIALLPFAVYAMESSYISTEAINVLSAGTSIKYAAKEG